MMMSLDDKVEEAMTMLRNIATNTPEQHLRDLLLPHTPSEQQDEQLPQEQGAANDTNAVQSGKAGGGGDSAEQVEEFVRLCLQALAEYGVEAGSVKCFEHVRLRCKTPKEWGVAGDSAPLQVVSLLAGLEKHRRDVESSISAINATVSQRQRWHVEAPSPPRTQAQVLAATATPRTPTNAGSKGQQQQQQQQQQQHANGDSNGEAANDCEPGASSQLSGHKGCSDAGEEREEEEAGGEDCSSSCVEIGDIISQAQLSSRLSFTSFDSFYFPSLSSAQLHALARHLEVPSLSRLKVVSFVRALGVGLVADVESINYLRDERSHILPGIDGYNDSALTVHTLSKQLENHLTRLLKDTNIRKFLTQQLTHDAISQFDADVEFVLLSVRLDIILLEAAAAMQELEDMRLNAPLDLRRILLRRIWGLVDKYPSVMAAGMKAKFVHDCGDNGSGKNQSMADSPAIVNQPKGLRTYFRDIRATVRNQLHMLAKVEASEAQMSVTKFFLKVQGAYAQQGKCMHRTKPLALQHQPKSSNSVETGPCASRPSNDTSQCFVIEGEPPPLIRNIADLADPSVPLELLSAADAAAPSAKVRSPSSLSDSSGITLDRAESSDGPGAPGDGASLDVKYLFERLLPFHLADVAAMQRHWEFYVEEYYTKQLGMPVHMRLSFPRYVGLNPYMTQARLARLYGSDPTLFEKLLHHKLSDTAVQTQVQYLDTAAERAPYRVHIEDGLFLVYNDFDCVSSPSCNKSRQRLLFDTGKLFSNCSGPGYGIHVFRDACSEECDFDDANNTARAEDELYAYSHKVGHFHHSSFLAGQKVSFAGELQVVRGKLSVITNKSGHYKPTEAHALVQLLFFHRTGVRLEDVTMKWVKGLNEFDEECAMTALQRLRAKYAGLDLRALAVCQDIRYVSPFERLTVEWLDRYCPGFIREADEDFLPRLVRAGLTFADLHPTGGGLILALRRVPSCREEFIQAVNISIEQFERLHTAAESWYGSERRPLPKRRSLYKEAIAPAKSQPKPRE